MWDFSKYRLFHFDQEVFVLWIMFIIHIKFHNVYKVFGTLTLEAKETHPNSTRLRIYQSLSGVCKLALLATMHLTLPIQYL